MFLLPILQRLSVDPLPFFAVLVVPTRELATHIEEQFKFYGAGINLRTALCIGGTDALRQRLSMDSLPHVVVGTPGRMAELFSDPHVSWQKFKKNTAFAIFDEFDRLVEPSLFVFVKQLVEKLPEKIQCILSTATYDQSLIPADTIESFTRGKAITTINQNKLLKSVSNLSHKYIFIPQILKDYYFLHLIKSLWAETDPLTSSTIVFFNTCRECHFFHKILNHLGIVCTQIHSFLNQKVRNANLFAFQNSQYSMLLCTDVIARGMDVRTVKTIVNYSLPLSYESYIQRAGRAGRTGEPGEVYSLVDQYEVELLKESEKRVGSTFEEIKYKEDEVLLEMGKLDKLKAKLKVHFMAKGIDEKFSEMKKNKVAFQKSIKKKIQKN